MAVAGTFPSGVRVRVEDEGSALLVDVILPRQLSASTLSLDLQEGLLRVKVAKPAKHHAFDELTELDDYSELDDPSELAARTHIISPDASGV